MGIGLAGGQGGEAVIQARQIAPVAAIHTWMPLDWVPVVFCVKMGIEEAGGCRDSVMALRGGHIAGIEPAATVLKLELSLELGLTARGNSGPEPFGEECVRIC